MAVMRDNFVSYLLLKTSLKVIWANISQYEEPIHRKKKKLNNCFYLYLQLKLASEQMLNACASIPWVVKLKSEGFSLPLGSLTLGSRSSSKKECAQASKGVRRAVGVYSSRREHRAMASGGVRGRNTWTTITNKDGRQQWSLEVYSWVFPDKRRHSTLQHTQTHTHTYELPPNYLQCILWSLLWSGIQGNVIVCM